MLTLELLKKELVVAALQQKLGKEVSPLPPKFLILCGVHVHIPVCVQYVCTCIVCVCCVMINVG